MREEGKGGRRELGRQQAKATGPVREGGWADSRVGLDSRKMEVFKRKSFCISIDLKIDQIQMKFEFNPQTTLPYTQPKTCFGMNATNMFLNFIVNFN